MILAEDILFINQCLSTYYKKCENEPYGLLIPYEFPEDMIVGKENKDGLAKWKMLPSKCNESNVRELEEAFNINFPPLFRAYLVAKHHLFTQVYNSRIHIEMPALPSNDPYGDLITWLDGWQYLIDIGYIPFAIYEGGAGPVCFDTNRRLFDGDCPIVWFDHDILSELSYKNSKLSKASVESEAEEIFKSFRELMTDLFLNG